MSHRYTLPHVLAAAAGLASLVSATTAYAGDGGGWRNGSWYGDDAPPQAPVPISEPRSFPSQPPRSPLGQPAFHQDNHRPDREFATPGREAWLADCRSRVASRDNGVGGAVIGGVVGGVAGNRIAGRHNRTIGTVGGAALGAVAGSAIDRAEDRGRGADECEAYLNDYYARYAAGGYGDPARPGYGYAYTQPNYGMNYGGGYAYAGGTCCGTVPVMVPVAPECTETIEYIYEDVPVPRRAYRRPVRHTKIVRDKRIKIASDKRVSVD